MAPSFADLHIRKRMHAVRPSPGVLRIKSSRQAKPGRTQPAPDAFSRGVLVRFDSNVKELALTGSGIATLAECRKLKTIY
ncbi:MAG: hypothetical protein JWM99_2593 [Verrucomicrobiales bacterium]|nr:hypothetical protein [Verrucomicrobiales bacterium]